MFTFGREHEIKHAIDFIGSEEKSVLLIDTINAVHDYLENKITSQQVKEIISTTFTDGKSGTWESAGSWLLKLGGESSELIELWEVFALHKSSKVRYRVAAHINDLPKSIFPKIAEILINDKSSNVRSKATGDLYFSKHQDALSLLNSRRQIEENEDVIECIDCAIEGIQQHA